MSSGDTDADNCVCCITLLGVIAVVFWLGLILVAVLLSWGVLA